MSIAVVALQTQRLSVSLHLQFYTVHTIVKCQPLQSSVEKYVTASVHSIPVYPLPV